MSFGFTSLYVFFYFSILLALGFIPFPQNRKLVPKAK